MPRTQGEKERIEKRIRLEKTLVPIACVIGLAVFVLVCVLLGKKTVNEDDAFYTPAPTEDPCYPLIRRMAKELGGQPTEGDGFASFSFTSGVDLSPVAVSARTDSGVVTMQLARKAVPLSALPTPEATPAPTQSIFVIDMTPSPVPTEVPAPTQVTDYVMPLAEEVFRCLSYLEPAVDTDTAVHEIADALSMLLSGDTKKASVILGVYMVELSYTQSEQMLRVSCEPI